MLFQRIKQLGTKAEIACHKLSVIFRSVHTCKIEHKIRLLAILFEFSLSAVDIIFKDFFYSQRRAGTVLAVADVLQIRDQSLSDHTFRAGD